MVGLRGGPCHSQNSHLTPKDDVPPPFNFLLVPRHDFVGRYVDPAALLVELE